MHAVLHDASHELTTHINKQQQQQQQTQGTETPFLLKYYVNMQSLLTSSLYIVSSDALLRSFCTRISSFVAKMDVFRATSSSKFKREMSATVYKAAGTRTFYIIPVL